MTTNVRRGFESIAAALDVDRAAGSAAWELDDLQLRRATALLSMRTALPFWLPAIVAKQIGHARVVVPDWLRMCWLDSLHAADAADEDVASREVWNRFLHIQRRQDMLATARMGHRRLLYLMTLERGAWAGDTTFERVSMALSMHEDELHRRMRMTPNPQPVNYTDAAYKAQMGRGIHDVDGKLSSAAAAAPSSPAPATAPVAGEVADAFAAGALRVLSAVKNPAAADDALTAEANDNDESAATLRTPQKDDAPSEDDLLPQQHDAEGQLRRLSSGSDSSISAAAMSAAAVSLAEASGDAVEAHVAPAPPAVSQHGMLNAADAATRNITATFAPVAGERPVVEARAKLLQYDRVIDGTLRVSTHYIYFEPLPAQAQATDELARHYRTDAIHAHGIITEDSSTASGVMDVPRRRGADVSAAGTPGARLGVSRAPLNLEPRRWSLALLERLMPRRYLLQPCALEAFYTDGASTFFAFSRSKHREVFQAIIAQRTPRLSGPRDLQPKRILRASGVTERWQRREMSNFEYLMELNRIAGRSFNDLMQYPVLPWVIRDYSSASIDVTDSRVYRDLSRPMGGLNSERLAQFKERMEGMAAGSDMPAFLYGTHYSSAGVVLFFLLRLEPFTSMAVDLQNGHFDVSDRMFFSIPASWHGVMHSLSDVKELIPEWYTTPEMFMNGQRLPLGELQDGAGVVDDVILPPWARSAAEFVWTNRAALESEYVSAHLHEWVDLIFGYKQRGPAALEADNLFYYLTYEDAVDLQSIDDPIIRQSTISQIVNFGQTPSQLFKAPHPQRYAPGQCAMPIFTLSLPVRDVCSSADSVRSSATVPTTAHRMLLRRQDSAELFATALLTNAAAGSITTPSPTSSSSEAAVAAEEVSPPRHSMLVPHMSLHDFSAGATPPRPTAAAAAPVSAAAPMPPPLDAPSGFVPPRRLSVSTGGTVDALTVFTMACHPQNSAQIAAVQGMVRSAAAAHASVQPPLKVAFNAALATVRPVPLNARASITSASQQVIAAECMGGRLVAVYGDASAAVHRFSLMMNMDEVPFDFKCDKPKALAAAPLSAARGAVSHMAYEPNPLEFLRSYHATGIAPAVPFMLSARAPVVALRSTTCVMTPFDVAGATRTGDTRDAILVTCGYVDGGMRWQSLSGRGKGDGDAWTPRNHVRYGDVTCLSAADDGCTLVTGHADCSVHVWRLVRNSESNVKHACGLSASVYDAHASGHYPHISSVAANPLLMGTHTDTIFVRMAEAVGQRAPVTCVAAHSRTRLLYSGALDGCLLLHCLLTGKRLRVFSPDQLLASLPGRIPGAPRVAPITHIAPGVTGYATIHWAEMESTVATRREGAAGKRRSILASVYLNASTPAAVSVARTDVTALTLTRDGTAVLIGYVDGRLDVANALTLDVASSFTAHIEAELPPVGGASVDAAIDVASTTVTSSGAPASAISAGLNVAKSTFSRAFGAAKKTAVAAAGVVQQPSTPSPTSTAIPAPTVYAVPVIPPSHMSPGAAVPAVAITSIAMAEDETSVVLGTGDGRLCILCDPSVARRTLAMTVQQGLFGLV